MKTNAEMLRTIIEYAVERGWKVKSRGEQDIFIDLSDTAFIGARMTFSWADILFDKSFAKAVFGEKASHTYKGNNLRCDCGHPCTDHTRNCPLGKPDWQYRLQKCVLSDDPILYYYNFVTERREG